MQTETLKSERNHSSCGIRGVTVAPTLRTNGVATFCGFDAWQAESSEPDELIIVIASRCKVVLNAQVGACSFDSAS